MTRNVSALHFCEAKSDPTQRVSEKNRLSGCAELIQHCKDVGDAQCEIVNRRIVRLVPWDRASRRSRAFPFSFNTPIRLVPEQTSLLFGLALFERSLNGPALTHQGPQLQTSWCQTAYR